MGEGLGAHAQPPDDKQADRQVALHPQTASDCHEQRGLLLAVSLHLPGEGLRGDAQHEQQDRGGIHRLKKNLNNHSGMGEAGRKRFISEIFLALADNQASHNDKAAP